MPHFVQLADAAGQKIEETLYHKLFGLVVFRRLCRAQQRRHFEKRHQERFERTEVLKNPVHFRQSRGADFAFEKGIHRFNALKLQLHVGVGVHLIQVHKPLVAVDDIVHADLSAFGVRVVRRDLDDCVHFREVLFQRRHIVCNHLDQRQGSVEEDFIGI